MKSFYSFSNEKPAVSSIFIIIGVTLLALVIGNVVGTIVIAAIAELNMNDLINLNQSIMAAKNGWWAMIIGQGVVSAISFIGAALFYWYVIEKKKFSDFNYQLTPTLKVLFLVFLVQICLSPFIGWSQSINEKMHLPEALSGLELFMRNMENSLADLTKFLTTFSSPLQYITAFIVIAVFAGIGEELLFRGLIQRKLFMATNNPHIAIWGAAIIFSAIHFQFYGFLPRMFLGALFGYLYFWSGNIWISIMAHVFNNGLAVTLLYMVHLKVISPEIEKMDSFSMPVILGFTVVSIGILYLIYKNTRIKQIEK